MALVHASTARRLVLYSVASPVDAFPSRALALVPAARGCVDRSIGFASSKQSMRLSCRNFARLGVNRQLCIASSQSSKIDEIPIIGLNRSVSAQQYLILELAALLVTLGVVDAAYSGDWSRIGVISQEDELLLQKFVWFVAVAHTGTGILAAQLATEQSKNAAVAFAKGLLFGTVGLYEYAYKKILPGPDEEQ